MAALYHLMDILTENIYIPEAAADAFLSPLFPAIGKSASSLPVLILDSQLNQVAGGISGELCFGSAAAADQQGLFRTGQLCRALPNGDIQHLGTMNADEGQKLLHAFNDTQQAYPANKSITELFEEQAAATPDVIAMVFEKQKLTYKQLNEQANQLAHFLVKKGVKTDTLVPICIGRSLELMVAILGILKSGGAYVPIDPLYPEDRITYMLEDTTANVVVSSAANMGRFANSKASIINFDDDRSLIDKQSTANLDLKPAATDLAYIIYTSGSTGRPKGVMVDHRNVVSLVYAMGYLSLAEKDALLVTGSVSFDATTFEYWCMLLNGGTLVFCPEKDLLESAKVQQLITTHKISTMWFTSSWFNQLTDSSPEVFAGLTTALVGGEKLSETHIGKIRNKYPDLKLINGYGPTENTTFSLNYEINDAVLRNPIPIGKPLANRGAYVLNSGYLLCPVATTGEIYLGGDGIARGYLNKPELTAEKFVANPFSDKPGDKLYRTGDLGKWLPDGNIEYIGRTDDQVKVRGYRIELGEIESVLQQSGLVKQGVVLARDDSQKMKRLIGYVVLNDSASKQQVQAYMQEKLPDYMVPAVWVALDQMPLTSNGKTDRHALPDPDHNDMTDSAYIAHRNKTEQILAAIWQQLLAVDKVGVNDNFFKMGGNSLLALKTVTELKAQNFTLPVTKLYQYPTIAGIAAYLDGNLKTAKATLPKSTVKADSGDIAVIGMAGRFPGANTIDELWQVLTEGRETTKFFTDAEIDPFIPPNVKYAPNYVKARGVIDKADEFDPMFFGLNPKAAELMDPQQRIFLEIAWEALESTGHLPSQYNGSVGVFAGTGVNTYFINNVIPNQDLISNVGVLIVTTLNEKDYVSSRTAYELNLTGPAVSVHSACSTSLLAIAEAVASLRNGQCNVALAGGASITSPINSGHLYQEGTMLSADGHCRSFDADADGTVFSDGAGVVLLKRLEEAIHDGDTVYSVIKGVGVNNDGGDKGSFTAPNASGQAGAIAMAIQNAGVSPADISYVETHGTATKLGDPIEIEGLTIAFGPQVKNQYCAIGSIKSNMGHLTAAAGVAGFIKTTLALYNKQIPASLFYERPNPNIDFEGSPFYVNATLTDWNAAKRIAGVSSFGVGGTNVHVVLEEYPREIKQGSAGHDLQLFTWSAKTGNSINGYRDKLASYITNYDSADPADIAYTLQTTRTDFNHRSFVVAGSKEELLAKLNAAPDASSSKKIGSKATEVAFMFPGQGAQYLNMGRDLYDHQPVFKAAVDECVVLLKGTEQENILDIIFSDSNDDAAGEALKNTLYTQPALFIISYAMAKLWISWGIEPTVLTGHSIGEFVAGYFAGIFTLPDAVKLIATRAKMVTETPTGSMVSVRLSEEELKAILPDTLSIAVVNSNLAAVAAGTDEEINKFVETLTEKGIAARVLQTSHAFHSAMMDPIVAPFESVVKTIQLNRPVKPIISTITGNWMTDAEAIDPAYWAHHLRNTVRFAGVANVLAEGEGCIALEVGPGKVLSGLVKQQAGGKTFTAIAGIEESKDVTAYGSVLKALGTLWLNGIEPAWKAFYAGQTRLRVNIPTYAFDRKRYWVDPVTPINVLTPPFEVPTETPIDFPQETPIIMANRKATLIEKLKEVFEVASGIDIDSTDTGFVEIGFDSLLLTQIATNLKKEFNVPITFRKLFEEHDTLDLLANYLDEVLPADKYQQAAAPAAAPQAYQNGQAQPVYQQPTYQQPVYQNGQQPVYAAAGNAAMTMIAQQLQLLASQLATLQGGGMPVSQTQVTLQPPPIQKPVVTNEKVTAPVAPASLQPDLTPEEQIEIKKPFGATAKIDKHITGLNEKQQAFLDQLIIDFSEKTKTSKAQTQQHRPYMADPRVVSGFKPLTKEIVYPIVVKRSKGSRLWDVDDNEYVDALNGFGSNMLGYQPDVLKNAIAEQLEKGYEIGPQHKLAGEVCKMLCDFTGFDRAALCSTGSEAILGAMRIARTVTGRSIIVAFSGSYHGIIDEVIVRGTKKLRTVPAAPGIMPENVQNMLILDYGTDESLRIIEERKDEIAAVLVEVVQSRRPEFLPLEFLKKLRKITAEANTALIFDEVITGFRMHPGGMQAITGIRADLGTYGKVIGGGLPVGAIIGKKEYMDALDGGTWQFGDDSSPDAGVTYFAGTFVRHPLALAAVKASLTYMKERGPALQQGLNDKTTRLAATLNEVLVKYKTPMYVAYFGSLWKVKYHEEFPYSELIFTNLRLKGLHIMDGFPCFMTDAHTDADVDFITSKFEESISEMVAAEFIPTYTAIAKPAAVLAPIAVAAPTVMGAPPVPGAKLGRDKDGNPGWFISDEKKPGKYLQVK